MKTNKAKCPANTQRNRQKAQARKTRERSKSAFMSCITRPLHRMPVLDLITPDGLEQSALVMAKLDKLGALSRSGHRTRALSAIEAAWNLANA